jgi:predicted DNA-binding ArsR family transcriptional regulator
MNLLMNRIKVINEPSELVPMLRSVDTPVKRDVLKEVTLEWRTADEIEQTFGQEGREAIIFFEKMKLVETRWLSKNGGYPEKSYHTYYTSFSINAPVGGYANARVTLSGTGDLIIDQAQQTAL